MLIIGLAGGIASGKSFVATCFQQLGAKRIDADKVGHEVLDRPQVQAMLVEHWGEGIVVAGKIDRRQLARIVFDPDVGGPELKKLEQITHPRIRDVIESHIESFRQRENIPAVVLDAPLMFRAGWDQICDRIVFVDAPAKTRQERAKLRGWNDGELKRRESRQLAIEEKRKLSTDVIDNSGNEQKTRDQVGRLWLQWDLPLQRT